MLNVALPKGRLARQVYSLLERAGYSCEAFEAASRKLVVEDAEHKMRYFLVKPADVAIYVERGAADVGVVGKDILLETRPDVYELLDLGLGVCKMAVAAPGDFSDGADRVLRVATKFPGIAREHYASDGRQIEIIKLSGSIELAPILGLSDVIVDIVETGATLRENNLRVLYSFMDISARLIVNKASYKFKLPAIERMARALEQEASQ